MVDSNDKSLLFRFTSGSIHPAIIKLGLQHAEGIICGSNARCVSLLFALKQVGQQYIAYNLIY